MKGVRRCPPHPDDVLSSELVGVPANASPACRKACETMRGVLTESAHARDAARANHCAFARSEAAYGNPLSAIKRLHRMHYEAIEEAHTAYLERERRRRIAQDALNGRQ